MSLSSRFSLALRVLFDSAFAARLNELSEPKALPEPAAQAGKSPGAVDGALQLLALLQREGRLVDLQQDITSYSDADIGTAARVVHEGCRRALRAHASVQSIRSESEGASITVDSSEGESSS